MQRQLLLLCLSFIIFTEVKSQFTKTVIFFTDKNETTFSLNNPSAYLSARTVARRTRYNIAIDSNDLPVIPRYIDSVVQSGTVKLLGRSRWLNAIIIQTSDAAALSKINSFPFVKKTSNAALRQIKSRVTSSKFLPASSAATVSNRFEEIQTDTFNYSASSAQIKIHKGEFLHNIGARGQGMQIAFLDAGYTAYSTNPLFDTARLRKQFLGKWNFVQTDSLVEVHTHGLACLSIVGAYKPGTFVGSCPDAGYYLLCTEDDGSEQLIEEYNWVLGAEYADSSGVDVITSSLGYTTFDNPSFNHTYADLNGNTTVAARMANLAAKKGILVLISAGNDGNKSWHYISTPADADSVIAVGAVDANGLIAAFSSFGPSSDGQIKPDVVSLGAGTAISNTAGSVVSGNGTSYACPNLAGLATCLWQLFPEVNNRKIISTIQKSSDKYNAPQAQYGYGLPDMKKAVGLLLTEISTMNTSVLNCTATVSWSSKDISTMRYSIERKLPGETGYTQIKTVTASGNTFSTQSYSVTDSINSSMAGTVAYRIKQVIDTSATGYDEYVIKSDSAIISACFPLSTSNIQNRQAVELYPNPASSNIVVKFIEQNSIPDLMIQIVSINGQILFTENYSKPSGSANLVLHIQSLPKGKYNLLILKKGIHYSVKEFIKQ